MKLVDVHCHLESRHFAGSLDTIISDAKDAGLAALITCAIVPDEWKLSRAIAHTYKEVYYALGIHPWYIQSGFFEALKSLLSENDNKYAAIGEIGLDAKTGVDFQLQKQFFEEQVAIANELRKPIIVHCRGAFNELIASLKRIGKLEAGGVIHSYSGNADIAKQLIPYGFMFSFGGAVTFRNSKKKIEVLKHVYPHFILIETDSPDIPPVEKKDQINVPAHILYVVNALSEITGNPISEIADATANNAIKLFGLTI